MYKKLNRVLKEYSKCLPIRSQKNKTYHAIQAYQVLRFWRALSALGGGAVGLAACIASCISSFK